MSTPFGDQAAITLTVLGPDETAVRAVTWLVSGAAAAEFEQALTSTLGPPDAEGLGDADAMDASPLPFAIVHREDL